MSSRIFSVRQALQRFVLVVLMLLDGCRHHEVSASGSAPVGSAPTLADAALAIPYPESFVRVDDANKDIHLVIVVVGDAAESYLCSIYEKTAHDAGHGFEGSDPSRLSYFPLRLGDIRGFHTNFHLYALGRPESEPPPIERYVKAACALIVVGRDPAEGEAYARRARTAKPDVAVAFLGQEDVARAWTRAGGRKPVFESAATEDAYMPALKAIAKACLTDLRDEGSQ
jgi:hypothetical protein